jgi:hypothetical protein
MNTLFTNEKLGMPVEAGRLGEIRQQIDAQRLADVVKPTGTDHSISLPVGWLNRAKAWLMLPRWRTPQPKDDHVTAASRVDLSNSTNR